MQLTWSDLFMVHVLDTLHDPSLFSGVPAAAIRRASLAESYPRLEALRTRVNQQKGVREGRHRLAEKGAGAGNLCYS